MRPLRELPLMRFSLFTSAFVVLGLAASASAQSASVVVSHNDPDGVVAPGQTVQITVRASWTQGWTLGWLVGDAAAVPDLGAAASPINAFYTMPSAIIQPGVPVLGSIRGYQTRLSPATVTFIPAFWQWAGVDALTYQWTAPLSGDPSVVQFDFAFLPTAPQVYLYQGLLPGSDPPIAVPTTVTPASLTVTPTPSTLALLAAASTLGRRRRRS